VKKRRARWQGEAPSGIIPRLTALRLISLSRRKCNLAARHHQI
jgi:hypothetical protein